MAARLREAACATLRIPAEFGTWTECNGAGLAATEDCHDGVYNDCDGLLDCTDEVDCGCACAPPPDPTALIDVLGGYSTVESCGPGCADLWVGRIGDNDWSGRCSIFEESTGISVLVPGAIRSAVLEHADPGGASDAAEESVPFRGTDAGEG
jgi:hypothetical protein